MNTPGLFDGLEASLRERFLAYHRENPEVYAAFDRFALEAIAAGRSHIGAKAIFERIRWYTAVEARDRYASGFKLNNNYHAFYARLWMQRNPSHAGLFATRQQRYAGVAA